MAIDVFRKYLLPGLVFTAAIIGGGYSTGRELVQFFLPSGPWGGVLGMAVTACIFSAVLATTFELCRLTRSYDYQTFVALLLGPAAVLFEIAYIALLVLVMAVLGAAAGTVAAESFGLPALAGTIGLMAAIGLLVFLGNEAVGVVLSSFAVILYVVYATIVVWSLTVFGERISASFAGEPVAAGWLMSGVIYSGYNVAALPAVLFCLRHQTRRREAIVAGLLAGPIAIVPALLLFVAMIGCYPEIKAQPVPLNFLLEQFQATWFQRLFQVLFFGILVKSGTALLHSINERVAHLYQIRGRTMPRHYRPAISIGVMMLSVYAAAAVGLIDLIAKGYGMLTYVFLALLVVPVLTVGIWRIGKWSG